MWVYLHVVTTCTLALVCLSFQFSSMCKLRFPPSNSSLSTLYPLSLPCSTSNSIPHKVEPTNPQKFNSFQASMSGPIDKANWVIPDLIMMGSYLEGKARKKGRQPTPPEAGGQCLLSGIGTFVCLMTKKEMGDLQVLLTRIHALLNSHVFHFLMNNFRS